jgi:hypothetical protein
MKRVAVLLISIAGLTIGCGGNVFSLEVGQCFNDPESFVEVSDVSVVDCGESHDNEVYHLFDLTGDDFPGETQAQDLASAGCLDAFAPYVGLDYESSSLAIGYLAPSEQSWKGDDREVVCFLYDLAGAKLAGTMRNAAI